MIQISREMCIGCGLCVSDCFPGALELEQSRPVLANPANCLGCGHCIAICPRNAVYDNSLDMDDSIPVSYQVSSDALLDLMRSRRSCRHFTGAPVPEELILKLIQAARACPSAKNLQGTRYIVVTKLRGALLDAALNTLGTIGEHQLQTADSYDEQRRARNFIQWRDTRESDPNFDPLFFHAPALLIFVSATDTARDTAAGAAYAELMAASLGLGCLYSGYFTACAAHSSEIHKLLELSESEQVVRCLVLGWPDIRFQRTAPRKKPNITYK